jgi:HSP20 family protein
VGTLSVVTAKRDFERLDELFEDLWRLPRFSGLRHGFQPQVDVYRRDDPAELYVVVELPGIDPADVQLAIEGPTLYVVGVRRRPAADSRLSYYRMEVEYGQFQRRITLPEDVDVEATRATYERGMLTIAFPIAAKPPAPEKISIPVKARR